MKKPLVVILLVMLFATGAVLVPRDQDNVVLQTGFLAPVAVLNKSFNASTGASVSQALTASTKVVRLATQTDCWILFGDDTVTVSATTGVYLPAGVERFPVGDNTYIAILGVSGAGSLNIVKME